MAQAGQVPPGAVPPFGPGQQPTPQQIQQLQAQFFAEAAKRGLTPQQFRELLIQQQRTAAAAAQQQGGAQPGHPGQPGQLGQAQPQLPQQGQQAQQTQTQVPIQPGPPKPEALALAKFLKSQDLKARECVLMSNGGSQRKELFKVKRAIRALQSPAYEKAQKKKDSLLLPIPDRETAEKTFIQLPMSYLALRVAKLDPNTNPAHGEPGHRHGGSSGKTKGKGGKKGVWTVGIVPQQMVQDDFHYVWLFEGSQWKQKAYAGLALVGIIAVVMFPLWPYTLRIGVWYISMACLGLLGAFFAMAIVRLILFLVTSFTHAPGFWLYPNLFEDVGFFDSFRPVWAWQETSADIAAKKKAKKEKKLAKKNRALGKSPGANGSANPAAMVAAGEKAAASIESTAGSSGAAPSEGVLERRKLTPRVEEIEEE